MDEDRLLMLLIIYMIIKRRRDINNQNTQRSNEIQRRIRHRQYFFQRQRRMIMAILAAAGGIHSSTRARTRATHRRERAPSPTAVLQPDDWLRSFHVSQDTFVFLCDRLRARLARPGASVSVETLVAGALWQLARPAPAAGGAWGARAGRRCLRAVCRALVALLGPSVLRPPGPRELEASARSILTRWGFPHCVGAIATLHTTIRASNAPDRYTNPYGWPSVLSQVAVNGLGHFWDACAGFPGGTNPVDILQNSELWTTASEGGLSPDTPPSFMGRNVRSVLLGGSCYPLQSWLMTPYPGGGATAPQRLFNRRLAAARCAADRALLRLRARWPCVGGGDGLDVAVAPTVLLACCVLHNVCEARGDPMEEGWLSAVAQNPQPRRGHSDSGHVGRPGEGLGEDVRGLFCDYFQQQVNGPVSGPVSDRPGSAV